MNLPDHVTQQDFDVPPLDDYFDAVYDLASDQVYYRIYGDPQFDQMIRAGFRQDKTPQETLKDITESLW